MERRWVFSFQPPPQQPAQQGSPDQFVALRQSSAGSMKKLAARWQMCLSAWHPACKARPNRANFRPAVQSASPAPRWLSRPPVHGSRLDCVFHSPHHPPQSSPPVLAVLALGSFSSLRPTCIPTFATDHIVWKRSYAPSRPRLYRAPPSPHTTAPRAQRRST